MDSEIEPLDLNGRRLRLSSKSFADAFAEGLAAWLAIDLVDVDIKRTPLSNNTAELEATIYTMGTNRTEVMLGKLVELDSPSLVTRALSLERFGVTINAVGEPTTEEPPRLPPPQPLTSKENIMMAVTITCGAVAIYLIIRKVRKRRRKKNEAGYSLTPSVSSPSICRSSVGWAPSIDDTAPAFEGLTPRRNSDPNPMKMALSTRTEGDPDCFAPPPLVRHKSAPSPSVERESLLDGSEGVEVMAQPKARVNALVKNTLALQATNRLKVFQAEAEARRMTRAAEQRANRLMEEAAAEVARASKEAESARQEAQRMKQEAERIKQEAQANMQAQEALVVQQAEAKAQWMQGMQNVMQRVMTEEARILHEEEQAALEEARREADLQRQHEAEQAQENLRKINEEANAAALRLQEALRFEEESKAALERMALEETRMRDNTTNPSPRGTFVLDLDVKSLEDTYDDEGWAPGVAPGVAPALFGIDVDTVDNVGQAADGAPAGTAFGIDVDALTPAGTALDVDVFELKMVEGHHGEGLPSFRGMPSSDKAAVSTPVAHRTNRIKRLEDRINGFERLTKLDLDGDGDMGLIDGWKPKPRSKTTAARNHPTVPTCRLDALRPEGLELSLERTSSTSAEATSSSPRSPGQGVTSRLLEFFSPRGASVVPTSSPRSPTVSEDERVFV